VSCAFPRSLDDVCPEHHDRRRPKALDGVQEPVRKLTVVPAVTAPVTALEPATVSEQDGSQEPFDDQLDRDTRRVARSV